MNLNCMEKNDIARVLTAGVGLLNATLVILHCNPVAVSDTVIYGIASVLALLIPSAIAIYKNNSTSSFGLFCKRVKEACKKYGFDTVLSHMLEELLEKFPMSEEGEADDIQE